MNVCMFECMEQITYKPRKMRFIQRLLLYFESAEMLRRLETDLRYVEDLLVESQGSPEPPKQGEIDRAVYYIKRKREDQGRWIDMLRSSVRQEDLVKTARDRNVRSPHE